MEARTAAQLAKIDRLLGKMLGIHPGVDLFVLPETAVTGYDRERWEQIAEPLPGRISDHFCRKTQELGKWICPGSIVEKDDAAGGMQVSQGSLTVKISAMPVKNDEVQLPMSKKPSGNMP